MRKDKKIDRLMREALTLDIEPDASLNERIVRKWQHQHSKNPADNPQSGKEVFDMRKRKKVSVAAMAAVCILAVSMTAVAAVKYLTKEEIVSQIGDEDVSKAINGEESLELNQTIEAGDYRFKLYAAATKEKLAESGLADDIGDNGGTYVILSIERLDGTPMPETSSNAYNDVHFFISPLIQGLEPWMYNIASMGGGYSTTVKNGVLYRIIECDDIALFANRHIYLCITDTDFYESEAYHYNETDGTISRNESYGGINLLLDLPIDNNRADEEKARAYLQELEQSWNAEPEPVVVGENGIVSTDNPKLDEIILKEHERDASIITLDDIPIENLLSYAVLEENSVQEVTVGEDRIVEYSYYFADGSGGSGIGFVSEEFLAGETDVTILGYGYSEIDADIQVCRREADGTIKFMWYTIK